MDSWLLLDIMMKQDLADKKRWAHKKAALELATEGSKGRLRAGLASLLARAAIRVDRDTGRATLAGAPNH